MTSLIQRIYGYIRIDTNNPELLTAQCAMLSRVIPMMYLIVMVNSWVLSAIFIDKAPMWLSVYIPFALSAVCILRLVMWHRNKDQVISESRAILELRRTNLVAALLAPAFCIWSFALYPYGDTYGKAHIPFFMMITQISCMMCLIHLRSAAFIIAIAGGIPFVIFFASTGTTAGVGMATNVVFVFISTLVIVHIHNRDFAQMVIARNEARRREQEQGLLLHMIDDMPVAVMTVEPESLEINYANETSKQLICKIEHLLPVKAETLLGTCIDVFHKYPQHQRRILADPQNLPHNARIQLGPEVLDLKVSAVNDAEGKFIAPMLTWALVTKEVEAEKRIWQLAHYDTLTGLPNRITFRNELERALASPGNHACLLYLDLDSFKLINDTRGHQIGDILLTQVTQRLKRTCNAPGTTIGRLGGDEFAVLLPHSNTDQATVLAKELISVLGMPYIVDEYTIQLGCSVGIALAPQHGEDAATLLIRSDIALHESKIAGKGQSRLFSNEMEEKIHDRMRLEAKLRETLKTNDGLFVFYQPIVDIEDNRITAREALVRWHHPKRGWISPAEFVPVAEQSGLIDLLGRFVMEQACAEAATWQDGARVAVNVSANQLGKDKLAPLVWNALAESGLSPSRLEIEITETALLSGATQGIEELRQLREMGVRVALDDFGTGYSSLAHLRMFPFDKIKIDGSFVKDAITRPDCAAVVKAVVDLGIRLGVTTVAEGVETEAHLESIRREGCREVQGYLYGRPVPSERDAIFVKSLNKVSPNNVLAV